MLTVQKQTSPITSPVDELLDCIRKNFQPVHPGAMRLLMTQIQKIIRVYDEKEYDVLVARLEEFLKERPDWKEQDDSQIVEEMCVFLKQHPHSEKMQALVQEDSLMNITHHFQADFLGEVVESINKNLPAGFRFVLDETRTVSWKLSNDSFPANEHMDLLVFRYHNNAAWLGFRSVLKEGITEGDLSEEERDIYHQSLNLSRIKYDILSNPNSVQDFEHMVLDVVNDYSEAVFGLDGRDEI